MSYGSASYSDAPYGGITFGVEPALLNGYGKLVLTGEASFLLPVDEVTLVCKGEIPWPGAATFAVGEKFDAEGVVAYSGAAEIYLLLQMESSGRLVFGGNASLFSVPALKIHADLSVFSGGASFCRGAALTELGRLMFGGTLSARSGRTLHAAEKIFPLSGKAQFRIGNALLSDGPTTFSGTAELGSLPSFALVGSGGIRFSGNGMLFRPLETPPPCVYVNTRAHCVEVRA